MTISRKKVGAEPRDQIPLAPENSTRRAPQVRASFDAAVSVLAELEGEVAQFALDAIERQPGAAEKLVAQRGRIDAARRAADELRAALELAVHLDTEADAVGAASLRAEQLAVFERSGAERVQAFTEVLQCVIRAAKAFGKYVAATQSMVDAVPSGTHLPVMGFGDGTGGPWLGNGEILIGREAYRIAELAGVPKLPFARVPPLSHGTSAKLMQPATEILEETQAAVLREITGQVAKMNRADLEAAGVEVPPLEIVEFVPPDPPPAPRSPAVPAVAASEAPVRLDFDAFAMTDAEALAGITASTCATVCGAHGCSLTGGAKCGHPLKGGLHISERNKPEVLVRYNAACKAAGIKEAVQ